MATTTQTLVDALLARVRDSQALGLSTAIPPTTTAGRTFARAIVTQAQRSVAAMEQQSIQTLTMGTNPNQLVYANMSSIWPTLVRIIGVQQNGKNLPFLPFRKLAQLDRDWFRRMGDSFECYSLFGRDVLILFPGKSERDSVSLITVTHVGPLFSDADALTVTDDVTPVVADVAAALAIIKLRKLEQLEAVIGRISERYKSQLGADIWLPKPMSSSS